ncbi:MAG: hypothetical protein IJ815_03080, partial [Lachnospiraceae bacterium]|nr:hypothetical protein [Lachnospiraceae bacterium]
MKVANLNSFDSMAELEGFMMKRDAELEQWRARCHCCSNCGNCYEEEGQEFCKKWDDVMENPD